jgi:hypothetical protein
LVAHPAANRRADPYRLSDSDGEPHFCANGHSEPEPWCRRYGDGDAEYFANLDRDGQQRGDADTVSAKQSQRHAERDAYPECHLEPHWHANPIGNPNAQPHGDIHEYSNFNGDED